jgi:hypothetical protein
MSSPLKISYRHQFYHSHSAQLPAASRRIRLRTAISFVPVTAGTAIQLPITMLPLIAALMLHGTSRRSEMPSVLGAAGVAATVLLALVNVVAAAEPAQSLRTHSIVAASATDIQAPPDAQVVELADRSMRIFMTSVREKSMRGLWNHISPRFRDQFSIAQLDDIFKAFYSLKITGDPLADKSPIFTAGPSIDSNSNLVVDGFYPTMPWRVSFHLVFAMEGRAWKLVGINVNAKPPPGADPPTTTPDSASVLEAL